MGRSVALRPNPYTPATVREMKERVATEIVATMDAKGLRAADVHKRYPSVRAGDISNLRAGDHDLYGLPRLIAMAEAIGLSFRLERAV
jgi:hypothetical protein